jgi:hypothetical protein
MNGSIETSSDQFILSTPRTSLQNLGEKRDDRESGRDGNNFQVFGADGFTFLDFLDIINPLQHIPFVSTIYRSITDDEIDPGSRITGGSLFGGPIGTFVALANVTIEQKTGQDIGNHMMTFFTGEDDNSPEIVNDINLVNSPQSSSLASATNPISTNAEVLEWAQRENVQSAEVATEAQLKTAPPQISNITTNIEVLNWAREEAALIRPTIKTAGTSSHDSDRETKRATLDKGEAAFSTSNALGTNEVQLSGATSPLGGWFLETMLLAQARYDESAQLGRSPNKKRFVEAADTNN